MIRRVCLLALGLVTACLDTLESPCGVPLVGSVDLEGFSAAEDRAVRALSTVPEFGGRDLCSELDSVVEVTVTPPGELLADNKAGRTWCPYPRGPSHIDVDGSYDWRSGPLTHEFAHHLIGCYAEGGDHPEWGPRGLFTAIELSRVLE